jgi:CP family cyanate transporter-like MFS transporter
VKRLRLEHVGLLAGLFLAALALRPQLVGVGPLIPEIQDDLDVSHAVAGLLGTIPVLCMGIFAPPGPHLARRLGTRAAISTCLATIAVFGVGRALVPEAAAVILLTVGVGVGMGLAQTLMPIAVKERFAHRPAFATGVYTMGINVGSALSAALAVPLAQAGNGWRTSLLVFSLSVVPLLAGWIWLTRRERPHRIEEARAVVPLPWRNPLAWRLVLIFGMMGTTFYGLNSWLPDSFVERGWSDSRAGELLAVLNLCALVPTLAVGWLADRVGSRRLYLVGAACLLVGATLGFVLLPAAAFAWAAMAGLATGALFPLVMTLPLDVSHSPAHVGAVAAMMLGAGYTIAAVSPFVLGGVRDLTGSFTAVLWILVGTSAALLALCSALSRERLRAGRIGELPAVP